MTEESNSELDPSDVPEAVIYTKKSFSIVWLVPLVAILLGGWLGYKALSEKGPSITITFKTAEGLEAGKTKIRYKDVEIGLVESISLSKDLSHVVLTAELAKEVEKHLTDTTRFWVVRAQLTAGEVSGLGTIFSGAYIAIDPGNGSAPAHTFVGLENPPAVTSDLPGSPFLLLSEKLGSIDIGSPVYFRQIKVGKVGSYKLEEDGQAVTIQIFINAPYDKLVYKNTRFWNASGLDLAVDASGIKIDTQSIVSLLIGGVAFDTPVSLESGEPANGGDAFTLSDNYQDTLVKSYNIKKYWVLYFEDSVRGLSPGAPVELEGIQIGQVADIDLEVDMDKIAFRIPILIETEPERIFDINAIPTEMDSRQFMDSLVAKGLRAQLRTGNILTGKLFVTLDFHPDAPARKIIWDNKYPELPTVQRPMEEIMTTATKTLKEISDLPLKEIGTDLRAAIQSLNGTLNQARTLIKTLDSEVGTAAAKTLEQAEKTLAEMEKVLGSDSPLNHQATRAMEELAEAARSVRFLVDYLERHPDSLIFGKEKQNDE